MIKFIHGNFFSSISMDYGANMSKMNLWDVVYKNKQLPKMYSDVETAERGAIYLNDEGIKQIEDWGCGWGAFKNFIAPHQQYIGIDGSKTPYADTIADLEKYISKVDGLYMRHVLEHNHGWRNILQNAIDSFDKKMVLVVFTPFQTETKTIKEYKNWNGTNQTMVDIGFRQEDIIEYFDGLAWSLESIKTPTQYDIEHVFYISK